MSASAYHIPQAKPERVPSESPLHDVERARPTAAVRCIDLRRSGVAGHTAEDGYATTLRASVTHSVVLDVS